MHSHHGGRGRGRGGYGGRGAGHHLPPTMPSTGWYHNADLNNPAAPSITPGDVTSAEPQHVVVVLGDGPSNSRNVAAAETVKASEEEQAGQADPLSSMDPLRQNLPEIGGVAAPAVSGEN